MDLRQLKVLLIVSVLAGCSTDNQTLTSPLNEPPAVDEERLIAPDKTFFESLLSDAFSNKKPNPSEVRYRNKLLAGAARLVRLQADSLGDNADNGYLDTDPDDGGWDLDIDVDASQHSEHPSPENTYGVTAMGILAGYLSDKHSPQYLTSLLDAYLGIERRTEVDSAPDFAFLIALSSITQNVGYADLARTRYDTKISQFGGAEALGFAIRDARGNSGQDGLIPFDLGWYVLSALALEKAFPGQGYAGHAAAYGAIVARDILNPSGFFNIEDPHERYYTTGLAWAVTAVSASHVDLALARNIRRLLVATQLADGSWAWNADYPDGNYQSTAAAVASLSAPAWGTPSRRSAHFGAMWLADRQLDNGGFEYAPLTEDTEIDAEILIALYLTGSNKNLVNITTGAAFATAKTQISAQTNRPAVATPLQF